jgi:hypothetical protein
LIAQPARSALPLWERSMLSFPAKSTWSCI